MCAFVSCASAQTRNNAIRDVVHSLARNEFLWKPKMCCSMYIRAMVFCTFAFAQRARAESGRRFRQPNHSTTCDILQFAMRMLIVRLGLYGTNSRCLVEFLTLVNCWFNYMGRLWRTASVVHRCRMGLAVAGVYRRRRVRAGRLPGRDPV